MRNSRWRRLKVCLAIVPVGIGVAACGSSSSTTSSNTAASSGSVSAVSAKKAVAVANAQLQQYSSVQAPVAPGPSFDASSASGKLVWLVEQEASNPAVSIVASNFQTAITHEGVRVLTCNAGGESVQISSCMESGLAQHPAAIVADGGDPTSYSAGSSAAAQQHVPVVSALDVPLPYGKYESALKAQLTGIAADSGPPDPLSGTLAADMVVSDSHDNANVLFIASPGILGSTYEQIEFDARLKQLCPSCTVDSQAVEIPNWPSDLGPLVTAQLALHPDINYVVPVFDPMAAYTDPAIVQAGKGQSVKVVTVNGSLEQMQNLAAGQQIVGEVGQDLPEMGYQAADQTLRLMTGAPKVTYESPAVRVFTSANIGSVSMDTTSFSTGAWYVGSTTALQTSFDKLWNGK